MELRQGVDVSRLVLTASPDTIMGMPTDLLIDFAAVHVIGEKAADIDLSFNITLTDLDENWNLWIRHGVLNARPGHSDRATLTVVGNKPGLVGLLLEPVPAGALIDRGALQITGDRAVIDSFGAVMDNFEAGFNLITP